ncbi:MAG: hypothetical protein KAV82_00520 [Phycisphaerae bacterium]|nr:hypothetical protein [Phycisphaerae bacterium]
MPRELLMPVVLTAGLLILAMSAGPLLAEDTVVNSTSTFLGPETEWAEAAVVIQQASSMFGAREYYISGAGKIVVVDVRPEQEQGFVERRYEFNDRADLLGKLLKQICQGDVLGVAAQRSESEPPPTGITPPLLILRNPKGKTQAVSFPRDGSTQEYEKAWLAVSALKGLIQDAQPHYTGKYAKSFIPQDFVWSAETVLPRRVVHWAPIATAQDNARLQEEYRHKVEIQLQAIEKNRAEKARADSKNQD